jgi:hypothetical protein
MDELSNIQSKIYAIRGCKVMLDFDLADIYGTETKVLKQSVRRNIVRFPNDFMFELTREEYNSLRSQIVTLDIGRGKYSKYLPFAFTEQGVAMLSSVLNSEPAIVTNIKIMRAFVAVRQLVFNPPVDELKELQNEVRKLKQFVEDVFVDQNDINEDTRIQLKLINESLAELQIKHKGLITDDSRIRVGYTAQQYGQKDNE